MSLKCTLTHKILEKNIYKNEKNQPLYKLLQYPCKSKSWEENKAWIVTEACTLSNGVLQRGADTPIENLRGNARERGGIKGVQMVKYPLVVRDSLIREEILHKTFCSWFYSRILILSLCNFFAIVSLFCYDIGWLISNRNLSIYF